MKKIRPTGWAWFGHLLDTGFFCLIFCPHYRNGAEADAPGHVPSDVTATGAKT